MLLNSSDKVEFLKSDFNNCAITIKIQEMIGRGHNSRVYKVVDDDNPTFEPFALKCVQIDPNQGDRELDIVRDLGSQRMFHILICTHFKVIEQQNITFHYYLSRFYQENLYQHMIRCGVIQVTDTPNKQKLYLYQILRGICSLHVNNIIHRDIKCSNVLVSDKEYRVVLADYGNAKQMLSNPRLRDQSIPYIGHRHYRAPEMLFGSKEYSLEADIYSFGVLSYHIIVGEPLFQSSSTSQQKEEVVKVFGRPKKQDLHDLHPQLTELDISLLKHSNDSPLILQKIGHLSRDEQLLILACLQWSPKRRYQCYQLLMLDYFDEIRRLTSPDYRQLSLQQFRDIEIKTMCSQGLDLSWIDISKK